MRWETARRAAVLLLSAFGPVRAEPPSPPARGLRDLQLNGRQLNGTHLGGARSLLYASLQEGVMLRDGSTHKGLALLGTGLRAPGPQPDLAGATLRGVASQGSDRDVRLRIDAVEPGRGPAQTLYRLSFREEAGWSPICPGGARVLLLAGRWDYRRGEPGDSGRISAEPTEVTVACEGAAIAKCVLRHGYRPWQGAAHDTLHQACVRASRADYCGTGESMTEEGTEINVHDAQGVQRDTLPWVPEALWTPAGAACVSSTRLLHQPGRPRETVERYIGQRCPERWSPAPCAPRSGANHLVTEHRPR